MVLLEFIIDTDALVDCCRDEWLQIYDKEVGSLHIHQLHNGLPITAGLQTSILPDPRRNSTARAQWHPCASWQTHECIHRASTNDSRC